MEAHPPVWGASHRSLRTEGLCEEELLKSALERQARGRLGRVDPQVTQEYLWFPVAEVEATREGSTEGCRLSSKRSHLSPWDAKEGPTVSACACRRLSLVWPEAQPFPLTAAGGQEASLILVC